MLTGGGTADPADVGDGPGVTPPPWRKGRTIHFSHSRREASMLPSCDQRYASVLYSLLQ